MAWLITISAPWLLKWFGWEWYGTQRRILLPGYPIQASWRLWFHWFCQHNFGTGPEWKREQRRRRDYTSPPIPTEYERRLTRRQRKRLKRVAGEVREHK